MAEANRPASIDPSKTYWAVWIPILATACTLVGSAIGWGITQYQTGAEASIKQTVDDRNKNELLSRTYLIPIEDNLKLNQGTFEKLNAEYHEPGWGVLESYVLKARRNGDPKKQTLEFGLMTDLVKRDVEIITYIKQYKSQAVPLTTTFSEQSLEFASPMRKSTLVALRLCQQLW